MGLAAVRLLIIIALIVVVGVVLVSSTALAQSEECDGARIVVEGGEPSPFILPVRSGDTIKVEPDAVVRIRAEGVLPDSTLRWSVRGFGRRVADFTHELGEFTHTVNVADYSSYTRGLYEVEGTLYVGPKEVCSVLARVNISGFGGVVAVAAVASAGVFGAGALASVPYSARGTTAKLKLKVQARRRRPRGWRRFVPVPAFKRTVFSTLMGAVTGLFAALVLQQGGVFPLSLGAAIWSIVAGGAATFGVDYSLGALLTLLRPPREEPG